jgi:hypothetical protein
MPIGGGATPSLGTKAEARRRSVRLPKPDSAVGMKYSSAKFATGTGAEHARVDFFWAVAETEHLFCASVHDVPEARLP